MTQVTVRFRFASADFYFINFMDACNPESKRMAFDQSAYDSPSNGVSLINRLPTELLIELFATCASSSNDASPITPLTLSSVCRLWKEVIYSSPRVWQLISLDDHDERPVSESLAHAELWLKQSAPLPFDVELSVESSDSVLPLLSPFLASINRWRHCWIDGVKEEYANVSKLFQPDLEPALHYLNLTIQTTDEEPQTTPTLYACGTFSQMPQHISMNACVAALPTAMDLTPLLFTAIGITEFSVKVYLQPADLLNFLVACPLLQELFFSGSLHDEESSDLKPPIVHLPHLHTLNIHNTCFQRTILSHLHAPKLRELHLENLNLDFELRHHVDIEEGDSDDEDPDYSQSPWSDHHTGMDHNALSLRSSLLINLWDRYIGMGLRKLITRSNPPLEVLDMDLSDMRAKDFRWCFDKLSTLRRFRITGSDMSDKVINLFKPIFLPANESSSDGHARPLTAGVKLPRLSVLKLYNCQRLSGKAIVTALGSRVQYTDEFTPESTLENVTIVGCTDFLARHADNLSNELGRRLRVD